MIEWYPDDEDEPDGAASANATPAISLHVSRVPWPTGSDRWEWTAEYPDDDGDDPHVLLRGTGLKSLDDAKRIAEMVLRRWIAEHAILCCATERVKGIRLTNRLSEILQFLAEHRSMMVDEALGEMVARELL